MAVSSIDMVQTNITGESNLIAVHNPVIFSFNANYSGTAPTVVHVDIYDSDDVNLGTFKCIPYADLTATIRQFIFVADTILRGFMGSFDDFVQSAGSLEYCENFTKEFRLRFYVYSEAYTDISIVALCAARQFGDDQNAESIYNSEAQTYITAEGKPVYLYIYNESEDNDIGIVPGAESEKYIDGLSNYLTDSEGSYYTGT
jgi:hypothetical protein